MICLDSGCIIDFLRGEKEAINIIEKHKSEILTTELSVFEVYFWIHQKKNIDENEERLAGEFFGNLKILPFDSECGRNASKILTNLMKEGKMIEQNDAFIAGIMQKNEINRIITKNTKHFERIKGIKVISY